MIVKVSSEKVFEALENSVRNVIPMLEKVDENYAEICVKAALLSLLDSFEKYQNLIVDEYEPLELEINL